MSCQIFFVSAVLCLNIVEILEMADTLRDWRDLKPPFTLVNSLSLSFKFRAPTILE